MSRTLADLAPGTGVWLDETVNGATNHVEYIYLGLDLSGNARLLRKFAVMAKRMHSSNVASYNGCEADLWMENEETGFLSRFDAATINALQPTTICYTDYNQSGDGTVEYLEITRRCMALSYKELGWGGDETDVSFLPALQAYYNTTSANAARIGRSADETAVVWWLRSGASAAAFRYVNVNGTPNSNNATIGSYWQRPAISVAAATIVSDEGADAIFLLPDGRRTWWQISATCKLGTSAKRPKKVKLLVSESDIQSANYLVTNNAGDAEPVWVSCANGGTAELANTAKETAGWELAVKIEARSGTHDGHVGEPVLIVETEEAA